MPSPFPGMDPYLEDPPLWEGFHERFIAVVSELLVGQLQPKYWVNIEHRVYIDYEEDDERQMRRSDAAVLDTGRTGPPPKPSPSPVASPTAVLEAAIGVEMKEWFLKVLLRDGWRVVSVIEVLSAANKRPSSTGHGAYLAKRKEVLASKAHLVEIDLLRNGRRPPFLTPLPPGDYYAFIHRWSERPRAEVYAIPLSRPLPAIPVPLLPGDADARVDLQRALELTYDRGAYHVPIHYDRKPVPPLDEEHRAWAEELLRAKGLRK